VNTIPEGNIRADSVPGLSSSTGTSAEARAADAVARAGCGLRLIFVNRYFYPDVSATSQMLFDLAQRLAAHSIEVHVVCSRQLYDNPAASLPASGFVQGVRVHRIWTSRFGRDRLLGRAVDYASFYVTAAVKLLSMVRRNDTVVAKTDPPLISIVATAVTKLRGAHLVNWLQDIFPEVASHLGANPLPRWLDEALRNFRDRSLKAARLNVVLGERMREHLQGRRIPAEQICIIENWADAEAITPMPVDSSELRRTLELTGRFVVAYSGNMGRAHEFETILGAAEQLRNDPRIVFLMIGGGVKLQQLRNAVEAGKLSNFRFLPYQPREMLSDSLAAADVHLACLLPELEGLIVPSKFYGILAAGRPGIFIGDTDGELAHVIREANCGAAFAIGDSAGLAGELERLMNDKDERTDMGSRARSLLIERYTADRAAQQWLTILEPRLLQASVMHRCLVQTSRELAAMPDRLTTESGKETAHDPGK
jgi:glycosyltransferase involved in cell wall biosynthesis